jgi:type I restriction enzyme M protein
MPLRSITVTRWEASKVVGVTGMTNGIVQELWNYCNVLRDDGLSYGDYVEQLTFLLFLKMADEQTRPPFNRPSTIPKAYAWPSLLAKDGDELESNYPAC